jgi:hypothetical protein
MNASFGSTFVAEERPNGTEGPDGTRGCDAKPRRPANHPIGAVKRKIAAKPGGDGVKIARYIARAA